MEVIHKNVISRHLKKQHGFGFKKNGNVLEAPNWDLNLGTLRHLKNLHEVANLPCPYFYHKSNSKVSNFFFQTKGRKCNKCSL